MSNHTSRLSKVDVQNDVIAMDNVVAVDNARRKLVLETLMIQMSEKE